MFQGAPCCLAATPCSAEGGMLVGTDSALGDAASLCPHKPCPLRQAYPGFNLVGVDLVQRQMLYLCNRQGGQHASLQRLPPGLHGVTNGRLHPAWPKARGRWWEGGGTGLRVASLAAHKGGAVLVAGLHQGLPHSAHAGHMHTCRARACRASPSSVYEQRAGQCLTRALPAPLLALRRCARAAVGCSSSSTAEPLAAETAAAARALHPPSLQMWCRPPATTAAEAEPAATRAPVEAEPRCPGRSCLGCWRRTAC